MTSSMILTIPDFGKIEPRPSSMQEGRQQLFTRNTGDDIEKYS
jgi:hypothetical protein